ncbi:MAG: FHA domain-containing protein [Bacteroidia bacterium]|nr:FHA domain-containing protein [Bacteroidia bacterium]
MRWACFWGLGAILWAQRAELVILLETSHLTCGKPLEIAKSSLMGLCGEGSGSIVVGTFSRLRGGQVVTWRTTPTLPLTEKSACLSLLSALHASCDSIYTVHLFTAVEEALRADYASDILILASGQESGRGTAVQDLLRLAARRKVRLHVISIGWLTNNSEAQHRLKQLAGVYEGGESTYFVIDPSRPDAQAQLYAFLKKMWQEIYQAKSLPEKAPGPASIGEESSPEGVSFLEKIPVWIWLCIALLGGGAGVYFLLRGRQGTSASSRPASSVEPSLPAPSLRLLVHYPHSQKEVQISPTKSPVTVGRAPDNTLVLSDPTVSSRHARFFFQTGHWYIQDLGSTNGTFVNEHRVTQYALQAGDKIRLGAIILHCLG